MKVAVFTTTPASAVTHRAFHRAPLRLGWYDLSVITLILASAVAALDLLSGR